MYRIIALLVSLFLGLFSESASLERCFKSRSIFECLVGFSVVTRVGKVTHLFLLLQLSYLDLSLILTTVFVRKINLYLATETILSYE